MGFRRHMLGAVCRVLSDAVAPGSGPAHRLRELSPHPRRPSTRLLPAGRPGPLLQAQLLASSASFSLQWVACAMRLPLVTDSTGHILIDAARRVLAKQTHPYHHTQCGKQHSPSSPTASPSPLPLTNAPVSTGKKMKQDHHIRNRHCSNKA